MALREIPGPGAAALAVGGVLVVLGGAIWWLMPQPRARKSTEYMRRARGVSGLGAPPDAHLAKATELVRRAKRELEYAEKATGCRDRVSLAMEAHMLASSAASESGADNIPRPHATQWGLSRERIPKQEREANVVFGLAMAYREDAQRLVESCSRDRGGSG